MPVIMSSGMGGISSLLNDRFSGRRFNKDGEMQEGLTSEGMRELTGQVAKEAIGAGPDGGQMAAVSLAEGVQSAAVPEREQ